MNPALRSSRFRLILHALIALFALADAGHVDAAENRAVFPQSVASGDPRPASVILWTRVEDAQADPTADLPVALEVAPDAAFTQLVSTRTDLLARATHDRCVKVRVTGLEPSTTYYYRFVYQGTHHSPVGRTRTAPAAGSAQPVRFAFLNCQDYVGRHYNTLADLAERGRDTLDFVVYLGDYVYETTGDPRFQATNATRTVRFSDAAGALVLGSGTAQYQAARSLDNYRDLYRTYRRDPALQRIHELFPVINIWDDHEYSDDNHGATATFFNGLRDEQDLERKRAAEQAFFEFLPVEAGLDERGVSVTAADLFPNTRIFREFRFGQLLHLLMTDYRTFRPDHLVPEDAFPGEVPLDEPTLSALLGSTWTSLRGSFDPYADLDLAEWAALRATATTVLTAAYTQAGVEPATAAARAAAAARGKVSARYLNGLLRTAGLPEPFPAATLATLPRGLSFLLLGKQDLFSSFGSRYAVPRDVYQIYAAWKAARNPASQDALGPVQTAWLAQQLAASDARVKVVGSSVSFVPITFDFAQPPFPLPPGFPPELQARIQLNADHWDGFPQGRQALLDLLGQHGAMIISGDIHASFISRHRSGSGQVVPEFTGTSVSSENFQEAIGGIVRANPATANLPGLDALVAATDLLIRDAATRIPGTEIVDSNTSANGYVILQVEESGVTAVYRHLADANVGLDLTAPAWSAVRAGLFRETRYAATPSTNGWNLAAVPTAPTPYRLQLLHASDLEGGVDSIGDAPNFAAIAEHFQRLETNTVTLSAGDNYIPGPFFNAAGDPVLRVTLDAVNEAYFGVTGLDIRETAGRADLTVMNIVGFDASALGNHEFDAGTATIRELVGTTFSGSGPGGVRWLGSQFPYLSANLDFSGDSSLNPVFTNAALPSTSFRSTPADLAAAARAPKIAPATLIERGGSVIGVVGATTPLLTSISSPGTTRVKGPGAGSNDLPALASLLQPEIDQLRARGVDKVILVTHLQQLSLELELVRLLRGVDIIIAGGSDTLLANPGDRLRAGDTAAGPYPIVTANAEGDPALVVSTDGQYKYLGRLRVDFDAQGRVLTNSLQAGVSAPYPTDDPGVAALWGNLGDAFAAGTKGALVRQLTQGVQGIVTTKDGNVVGRSEVFLEGRRLAVRTEESNLGNLTADANLWVARNHDPRTLISLKNGGGIRAEIGSINGFTGERGPTVANPLSGKPAGGISQLDIENSLRFNNALSLVTVTAEGLRQILEHGVAATRPGATPGQFPQVGGLRFLYDPSATAARFDSNGVQTVVGQRIRHLWVTGLDGERYDLVVRDGQLVGDPARPFRLVTLSFLADPQTTSPGLGGDSYPLPALISERVDLARALATDPGAVNFAAPGTEQDALAEYLTAAYRTRGFADADTTAPRDLRLASTATAAPRFFTIARTLAGVEVQFPTFTGRALQLEAASTPLGPWAPLGAAVVGDGTTRVVADPQGANAVRVYRLVE